MHQDQPEVSSPIATPRWCFVAVIASAMLGLGLIADQSIKLSSTYDEVTYLRVAADWWRTGQQESISRMGTPLTFFKIQQAPTLWVLDRLGLGAWIDDPTANQEKLLPVIRIGASWTWLVAFLITVHWAGKLNGPRSMAMAALLFAISPNLLAHGALATMEMPLVAGSVAMFYGFWSFLRTGKIRDFCLTAAIGGLAMSCKFTTILIAPILGLVWTIDLALKPSGPEGPDLVRRWVGIARRVGLGMVGFLGIMVVSNLIVTGFAMIPMTANHGSHPFLEGKVPPAYLNLAGEILAKSYPQDWVGFATQTIFQMSGGPSYLFGERRMTGWRHYYLVAMAVKVPLAFWILFLARVVMRRREGASERSWFLPVILVTFLLLAMMGSKRNFGYRYMLPIAPVAIVWVSALAEGGRKSRFLAGLGLAGMGLALGLMHPHELSYFNELTQGPIGGRRVLSDSNLDWGQGAKAMARLQRSRPDFRDVTLFYFGDLDPGLFGAEGRRIVVDANRWPESLPPKLTVETPYLAVSATLQWGPLAPEGYFRELDTLEPVAYTDDTTIAVYRTSDLEQARKQFHAEAVKTGRGPG